MSSWGFHEGTLPRSDTVVRADAPWGRRVGNDLKPLDIASQSNAAINLRNETVRRALPLREGVIFDEHKQSQVAYNVAQIALTTIPIRHKLNEHLSEAWGEVSTSISRAYPEYHWRYVEDKRRSQHFRTGDLVSSLDIKSTFSTASEAANKSSSTEVVGGMKMLEQWMILSGMAIANTIEHQEIISGFLKPSIEEVRHFSYSGVNQPTR